MDTPQDHSDNVILIEQPGNAWSREDVAALARLAGHFQQVDALLQLVLDANPAAHDPARLRGMTARALGELRGAQADLARFSVFAIVRFLSANPGVTP